MQAISQAGGLFRDRYRLGTRFCYGVYHTGVAQKVLIVVLFCIVVGGLRV